MLIFRFLPLLLLAAARAGSLLMRSSPANTCHNKEHNLPHPSVLQSSVIFLLEFFSPDEDLSSTKVAGFTVFLEAETARGCFHTLRLSR